MGSFVSSRLDFVNKNPTHPISFSEVEHELQHIKKREQLSSLVAVAGTVLAMVSMLGVLGGSSIILGALFAIAALGAAYSYSCRLAETGLRNKLMGQMFELTKKPQRMESSAPEGDQSTAKKVAQELVKTGESALDFLTGAVSSGK